MTAREQLDAYAARPLPDHVDTLGFDDTAETFAPEAIAALRAVLDLHSPETIDSDPNVPARQVCTECCFYENNYPCDTVTAITTALEAS